MQTFFKIFLIKEQGSIDTSLLFISYMKRTVMTIVHSAADHGLQGIVYF